jgi:hypothetical protein
MAAGTSVHFNRVHETTTTTGTGTLTLAGAVAGAQTFAAVGNKGRCQYTITDGTSWETGIGTYTVSGTTLSRDIILSSSNSGAAVSFGAGSKDVFLTIDAVQLDPANVPPGPASGWTWVNQGTSTVADGLNGTMQLSPADNASLNYRFFTKGTLPSAPYQVHAKVRTYQPYVNSVALGVGFYDGTKLMTTEFVTQTGSQYTLRVEKYNDVNTASGSAYTTSAITANPFSGPLWLRFKNDTTNLYFDISVDGYFWINLFSEAVGTFITPTKAGFGGFSATAATSNAFLTLLSWNVLTF